MVATKESICEMEGGIPLEAVIGPPDQRYLASGYKTNSLEVTPLEIGQGKGKVGIEITERFYRGLRQPFHFSSVDAEMVSGILGREILERSGLITPEASLSVASFTITPRLRITETRFPCSGMLIYGEGARSILSFRIGGENNFSQSIGFGGNSDNSRFGDADRIYTLEGYQKTDLKIGPVDFSDSIVRTEVSLTNDEVVGRSERYPFSMFDVLLLGQLLQAHICKIWGKTRPEIGTTWLLDFYGVKTEDLESPYNVPVFCKLIDTTRWIGTHSNRLRQSFTAELEVGDAYKASITLACSVPEGISSRGDLVGAGEELVIIEDSPDADREAELLIEGVGVYDY